MSAHTPAPVRVRAPGRSTSSSRWATSPTTATTRSPPPTRRSRSTRRSRPPRRMTSRSRSPARPRSMSRVCPPTSATSRCVPRGSGPCQRHRAGRPPVGAQGGAGRRRHGRRVRGRRRGARRVRCAVGHRDADRRPRASRGAAGRRRALRLARRHRRRTGRGDELSPALASGRFDWVLVPNDHGLSTPVVYGELDAHRERHAVDIGPAPRVPAVDPAVLHAIRQGDAACSPPPCATTSRPGAAPAARSGARPGAGRALRSTCGAGVGLGTDLAFLAADETAAIDLQVTLSAAGFHALHVHGPVSGARVV